MTLTARTRRVVWIVPALLVMFVALTVVEAALTLSDSEDLGTPSTNELLPPPNGAEVVAERSYGSEGSRGGGIRVLLVDTTPTRQPATAFPGAYLDALGDRTFRRPSKEAAISDDSGSCVTVDALATYLEDDLRPDEIKHWLRDIDRPIDTSAVVTAVFC